MTNDSPRHIAIAGGGLAGLATAALLARSGNRVTLFERSHELGGRAATSEHHGYFHNRGPHALYLGGAAAQVLAELDVSYTGRSPDLSGVAVRNGRAYTLPTSAKSMLTTRLFGVRARLEAGRQLLALRRVDPSDHRGQVLTAHQGDDIVGMVHLACEWWLDRRTMSRLDLVDYLSELLWGGLAGNGLAAPPSELLSPDESRSTDPHR